MSKKEDNRIQRNLVGAWGKLPPRDLPPVSEWSVTKTTRPSPSKQVPRALSNPSRSSNPDGNPAGCARAIGREAFRVCEGGQRVLLRLECALSRESDQYIRAKGMRHPKDHPEFHSPSEA
ncbi:hypothetical protein PAPYR_9932 [Paratrimastix pyriformis]|uniref:Uncharacterized protein n=1 Tax=Paratrimastix pyriformis TaxID=342808 RepID=A0ABQ8U8X1_9EUKA|nr:hypothetical protein PAPYR_9932 [Paratrimastix pyriformis]